MGAQYVAMQNIPYHKAIGMMMYTMLGTHPDISYTVTTLFKFSSNPGLAYWEAMTYGFDHSLVKSSALLTMPLLCTLTTNLQLCSWDHQYHAHSKHIDVHFHFIHWIIDDSKIWLIYYPTSEMVANTLTKALPSPKVKHFAAELSLHTVWGGVLE